MSNEPQLIWEKQVGRFRLTEHLKFNNGSIPCGVYDEDFSFHFGSWGTDRESITEQHCLILCQYMLDCNCNVSISSFAGNLAYAIADYEEEIE